jgi:hypothetical protein
MDANTPAWLQANTTEAPAPAVIDNGGITSIPPPAPPTAAQQQASAAAIADDEDDPDLPGVILTMRLANIGVAVAIIVISVCEKYSLFHPRSDLQQMNVYVVIASLTILSL